MATPTTMSQSYVVGRWRVGAGPRMLLPNNSFSPHPNIGRQQILVCRTSAAVVTPQYEVRRPPADLILPLREERDLGQYKSGLDIVGSRNSGPGQSPVSVRDYVTRRANQAHRIRRVGEDEGDADGWEKGGEEEVGRSGSPRVHPPPPPPPSSLPVFPMPISSQSQPPACSVPRSRSTMKAND